MHSDPAVRYFSRVPVTGSTTARRAGDVDALVLKRAGLATAAVGLAAIIVAGLVAGTHGVVGAAIAAIVVVVFFSAGQMTLGRVLKNHPELALSVALVIYLTKIGALFILIILFAGTTMFNTKAFAATVVACTIAWTIVEVLVFARTKVLYVEPEVTK